MISKDLEDSYLDMTDKFFPQRGSFGDGPLKNYLNADQFYNGGDIITVKYAWFTLLPERTVRKDLRLPNPENCDRPRQKYPSLRAGILYEGEFSRWLGIDSYLVSASRRDNINIADFELFRFSACPNPVAIGTGRNQPQAHIILWWS
jgi:hypothetical protein